jgi:hypothetical protein
MSFATLERAVLAELKVVAKNSKIRLKDIMEWSTGELKPQEGETYYFLPDLKVHCCVKLPAKKAAEQSVHPTVATVATPEVESTTRNSG